MPRLRYEVKIAKPRDLGKRDGDGSCLQTMCTKGGLKKSCTSLVGGEKLGPMKFCRRSISPHKFLYPGVAEQGGVRDLLRPPFVQSFFSPADSALAMTSKNCLQLGLVLNLFEVSRILICETRGWEHIYQFTFIRYP